MSDEPAYRAYREPSREEKERAERACRATLQGRVLAIIDAEIRRLAGIGGHREDVVPDLLRQLQSDRDEVERRLSSAEPRWHEVATEGLPPEDAIGADFWIFGETFSPRPMLAQFDGSGMASPWDPYEEIHGRFDYGRITHWRELPAPPTKDPR